MSAAGYARLRVSSWQSIHYSLALTKPCSVNLTKFYRFETDSRSHLDCGIPRGQGTQRHPHQTQSNEYDLQPATPACRGLDPDQTRRKCAAAAESCNTRRMCPPAFCPDSRIWRKMLAHSHRRNPHETARPRFRCLRHALRPAFRGRAVPALLAGQGAALDALDVTPDHTIARLTDFAALIGEPAIGSNNSNRNGITPTGFAPVDVKAKAA
jgi:hypothetical protein